MTQLKSQDLPTVSYQIEKSPYKPNNGDRAGQLAIIQRTYCRGVIRNFITALDVTNFMVKLVAAIAPLDLPNPRLAFGEGRPQSSGRFRQGAPRYVTFSPGAKTGKAHMGLKSWRPRS